MCTCVIECPIELGTVVMARPGLGREERELGSSSSAVERRGEVMMASTRRGAAGWCVVGGAGEVLASVVVV
ncbi:hypothetical protein M0R45_030751 [Rubus argutus]|uniref:Uncharacterized protein n=1 Tax=Rubus argutus TaxID=59490 RepID=A0AAW1WE49_RUBAR